MTDYFSKLLRAGTVKPDQRRVLFISHDDFRAGAQLFLLQFLTWLKANSDIRFEILIKSVCGDLIGDFEALAPVLRWTDTPGQDPSASHVESTREHLRRADIGLIYSNTFTNGRVLEALAELNCPVISHVHELGYWITNRTEPGNNESVLRHSDHFVAASRAVKENLIANLGVSSDDISIVYEFIPTRRAEPVVSQDEIRQRLGIPPTALVVGACGTLDWRKGADLFIPLAQAFRHVFDAPVHFLWVGGDTSEPNFSPFRHDLERTGLEDRVHFVGAQQTPLDYFEIFDAFALPSREDPFPLVVLEAASLAKPIVCFEGAGGITEFVEADCGFAVPYLDLPAMASRLAELLGSIEVRERLGRTARDKVRRRHDVDVGGPQLSKVIRQVLNRPAARAGK